MLNEEVKRTLGQYNQEKKANSQPNSIRMTKVHEQDHGEEDPLENPEPDFDHYHAEDSYHMQNSDNEELIDSHGGYSAQLAFSYRISKHSTSSYGSLVDRGANGGLAGADVCILERTRRKVSVTGIDNHELPGLDIVTCVVLIQTNHCKVNMIMHEHAYYGRGNISHSPCQIEWFHINSDHKSHHVGGQQVIIFLDGYATPLESRSGLMYMSILGKPTEQDLEQHPHVLLTSPHEWDPLYWIMDIQTLVVILPGHLIPQ